MMWKRFAVGSALMLGMMVGVASTGLSETFIRLSIGNAPPPPRVVFYEQPRYVAVPGSRVYVVDNAPGDYRMYRYGGGYYMTTNGYWYRSSNPRGQFVVIDRVPQPVYVAFRGRTSGRYDGNDRYGDDRYGNNGGYRNDGGYRNNDPNYDDNNYDDNDYDNAPAPPRVYFSDQPRFMVIPETRVYWVENMSPGSYDLYRYGGSYYMYNDGYWYRSSGLRGSYRMMRQREVPRPVVISVNYRSHSGRGDRGLHRGWRNRRG